MVKVKPYWYAVTGFVLLFIAVAMSRSRVPSPYEGFADGSAALFTMFGVGWCPHCTAARPIFESLGPTMTIGDKTVQLRYVDPEKDKTAAAGYDIQGYPTFYLEQGGSRKKYQGPRTSDGFRAFLTQELSA